MRDIKASIIEVRVFSPKHEGRVLTSAHTCTDLTHCSEHAVPMFIMHAASLKKGRL